MRIPSKNEHILTKLQIQTSHMYMWWVGLALSGGEDFEGKFKGGFFIKSALQKSQNGFLWGYLVGVNFIITYLQALPTVMIVIHNPLEKTKRKITGKETLRLPACKRVHILTFVVIKKL